jgi:hypothetical protein
MSEDADDRLGFFKGLVMEIVSWLIVLWIIIYCVVTTTDTPRSEHMKTQILNLRKLGLSISEISRITGYSLTQVCLVIRHQNDEDIKNDK